MSVPDEIVTQMDGVREYNEGYEVILVRAGDAGGRLGIKAINEGRNNETLIDLQDLIEWLQRAPESIQLEIGYVPSLPGTSDHE